MEDYEYIEGTGDLDSHNGRFAITPEYQDGTYAYFLTVDETNVDNTKFPYIMGLTTRETIDTLDSFIRFITSFGSNVSKI